MLKEAWIAGRHYKITGKGIEPVGELIEQQGDNSTTMTDIQSHNQVVVTEEFIHQRPAFQRFIRTALLCVNSSVTFDPDSNEWKSFGDATEIALQVCALKTGRKKETLLETDGLVFAGEYPFDSGMKRMTTIYKTSSDQYECFSKGALERLVPLCSRIYENEEIVDIKQRHHIQIDDEMMKFASKGMRVLAIAWKQLQVFNPEQERREIESNLTLVGLVAIYDPPRQESLKSVATCRNAGIVVHMATGDHARTAEAIAREVGILLRVDKAGAPLVLTATVFDKMTNEEVDALDELPRVLARCSPETKVKLINALHRRNKFVAMTGDGVNDAPAVKRADIGIAMGIAGSDVTKQASDITLTDDNFHTITLAVKEGRKLFANASNLAQHLLSTNVAETIVLVVGLVVIDISGLPVFPMSTIQILWLNMLTSSPVALALGVEEASKDIMRFPPRTKDSRLWTPLLITDTMVYGTLLGIFSLGSFVLYITYFTSHGIQNIPTGCGNSFIPGTCEGVYEARAVAFYSLSILILVHGFNCRHNRYSMFTMQRHNKALWASAIVGFLLTLPTAYIPGVNTGMFEHLSFT